MKRNGRIRNDYFIKLPDSNKDSAIVIIDAPLTRAKIGDTVDIVFLPEKMEAEFQTDSGFNLSYWLLSSSALFLTLFLILCLRRPMTILKYATGKIFHSD